MGLYTGYQSYKIQAYAVIFASKGSVVVDISHLALNWGINEIPTGVINVTLGRDVRTLDAAKIHTIVNELGVTLPIEIWIKVLPGSNSFGFEFEHWPKDFFKIFRGQITATTYTRTGESVSLTIQIAHWLLDLTFSSILSRTTHSLTPAMLSGTAGFQAGQGVLPGWLPVNMAAARFTPAAVQGDMWASALGPWLQDLTQLNILTDATDPNPAPNKEAEAALKSFEPFAYIDKEFAPTGKYIYGVPLQLPVKGLPGIDSVVSAISNDAANCSFESFLGEVSFWSKLMEFAGRYRFSIVPLVDTALIVPFMSGTRTPWQTIYAQEYNSIGSSSPAARPLRGVRILKGIGSMTGALGLQQGQAGGEAVLAGRYDNPNNVNGELHYENAPPWAANIVSAPLFGPAAAAPNAVKGNVQFPGAGAPPANVDPNTIWAGAVSLFDVYARCVYVVETLRGRTCDLGGKLRFDISPGSTVRVFCVEDRFVEQEVPIQGDNVLYGDVMRVTVEINCQQPYAGTRYTLMNTRTSFENFEDATSVAKHPLYNVFWNGSVLVENQIFKPGINGPSPFEANK